MDRFKQDYSAKGRAINRREVCTAFGSIEVIVSLTTDIYHCRVMRYMLLKAEISAFW